MLASEVLVEIRDRNLQRVGTITPKWLQLEATIRANNVGSWKLTLPGSHPMVEHLQREGSGITVALRGVPNFSGPTVKPGKERSLQNPDGTFTFEGVTDEIHLADALAYPEPGNANVATQAVSNDVRTGNAETLLREFVGYNISGALAAAERKLGMRQFIRLESVNKGLGGTLTKSPRFQNLLELCNEIATLGGVNFRMVQRGDFINFEVMARRNVSDSVRFDIANGTLASENIQKSPPTVTRAIVAGQGEGTARQLLQRSTAASLAAETSWGRQIEVFYDQRNTDETVELEQAGDEKLLESGFTSTAVKVLPSDSQTMLYAMHWDVGDIVAVVVDGQEVKSSITTATLIAGPNGTAAAAAIGDVTGFDKDAALASRVEDIDSRVKSIERTVEVSTDGTSWNEIEGKPTEFPPSSHNHSASQIASGTLPLARGGTGGTDAATARTALGAAATAHSHSATDINAGTLPIARGGTGGADAAAARSALGAAAAAHTHTPASIGAAAAAHTHSAADITDGKIPYKAASGHAASAGGTGGSTAPVYWDANTTILFPAGYFDVAPVVQLLVVASGTVSWVNLVTVTTTSITLRINRIGATPAAGMTIHWIATQGTPTTAGA